MIIRRKRMTLAFVLLNIAVLASATAYVALFYRAEAPVNCKFKELLFLYCPGCGGTRAVYYLLKLDFLRSFISNPIVVTTSLILLEVDIRAALSLLKNDSRILRRFNPRVFLVVPAVLILNFLIRNILLFGFGIDLLGDILR